MPSFCDNQSTSINSSSPEPQMISTEFSDSNIASIKIESSELPNVTQCKPNSEKLNSSSQVLNYTIENLLNSSPSPSSSRPSSSSKIDPLSSSKTNTVLQTNLTSSTDSANSILSYPAFYDYRRFIPYSDVGHVWKYFFPHNPNVGPGPIRQARGPRRQRTTFTHEQTLRLEMEYHVAEYISRGKRFQLADLLDLTENQIKIWFQNRRAKDKRIEKAIIEQQYRYIAASNLPKQINLSNCSTCSYTKHQFESSSVSSNITNDSKRNDHLIENNLKVESE